LARRPSLLDGASGTLRGELVAELGSEGIPGVDATEDAEMLQQITARRFESRRQAAIAGNKREKRVTYDEESDEEERLRRDHVTSHRCSSSYVAEAQSLFNVSNADGQIWYDSDEETDSVFSRSGGMSSGEGIELDAYKHPRESRAQFTRNSSMPSNMALGEGLENPTGAASMQRSMTAVSPKNGPVHWTEMQFRQANAAQRRAYNRMIHQQRMDHKRSEVSMREWVRDIMNNTLVGYAWEVLVMCFSILSCIVYVMDTYHQGERNDSVLEYILIVIFTVDLLVYFFSSKNRILFWLDTYVIIDVVTLVPLYFEVSLRHYSNNIVYSLVIFRMARIIRVLRVVRLFRVIKVVPLQPIDHKLIETVLLDSMIIFISSGLFQVIENQGEGETVVTFGESLYFVIVTISTVGYGDISPETTWGRVLLSFLIVSAIIFVPLQVNKLVDLFHLQSPYMRKRFKSHGREHVLLLGHAHITGMFRAFLTEFYHPDKMEMQEAAEAVVIMVPTEPTAALTRLVLDPVFGGQVTLLRGSVQSNHDLRRAKAQNASAAFILADYNSPDPHQEDESNTMRALLVENFSPDIDTFVQLCSQENR